MSRCPSCGELVTGERDVCPSCGHPVPDPARPAEQRIRAGIIAAFVLGALLLIGGMVRNLLLAR